MEIYNFSYQVRLCNGLAIEHPEQKPRNGVLPEQTDGQVGTKAGSLCPTGR